jgi:hypothetical protein
MTASVEENRRLMRHGRQALPLEDFADTDIARVNRARSRLAPAKRAIYAKCDFPD